MDWGSFTGGVITGLLLFFAIAIIMGLRARGR
jgi:hypothetical protein